VLTISRNAGLAVIDGFSALTQIGGTGGTLLGCILVPAGVGGNASVAISDNPSLVSIIGFARLAFIGGNAAAVSDSYCSANGGSGSVTISNNPRLQILGFNS